jgi:hypothetical protein
LAGKLISEPCATIRAMSTKGSGYASGEAIGSAFASACMWAWDAGARVVRWVKEKRREPKTTAWASGWVDMDALPHGGVVAHEGHLKGLTINGHYVDLKREDGTYPVLHAGDRIVIKGDIDNPRVEIETS